jgi:hypothetical protein
VGRARRAAAVGLVLLRHTAARVLLGVDHRDLEQLRGRLDDLERSDRTLDDLVDHTIERVNAIERDDAVWKADVEAANRLSGRLAELEELARLERAWLLIAQERDAAYNKADTDKAKKAVSDHYSPSLKAAYQRFDDAKVRFGQVPK